MNKTHDTVGFIVGPSTSGMFRIAVSPEAIREQDIVAVDANLQSIRPDEPNEEIRIWAKIQSIERMNPLFPSEAGHELSETKTNPIDTVLSLSREMVTAECQILGYEPADGSGQGRLSFLRYPPKPATRAYRPHTNDLRRILVGDIDQNNSALDIAHLPRQEGVSVVINGNSIVKRHLAILATTGAGKSWAAKRIIEELTEKNWPIVIFDPKGDYVEFDIEGKSDKVKKYHATFPLFEEEADTVAHIIDGLAYKLTDTMKGLFDDLFEAAKSFYVDDTSENQQRVEWLANITNRENIRQYGIKQNMWLIAYLAEAAEYILDLDKDDPDRLTNISVLKDWGWNRMDRYTGTDKKTFEGIKKRTLRAAKNLHEMEKLNKVRAKTSIEIPKKRTDMVKYGQISVVSLAGYTNDFQATIYAVIVDEIFKARVRGEPILPVLFLLEEAHHFAPGKAVTNAENRAVMLTKQIAQEGREFGVGLLMVSQRPSRIDETALAMCNSFMIMRITSPTDQNYIRRVIESLSENELKMLSSLEDGEAILSGQMVNFPVMVKNKPPKSKSKKTERNAFDDLDKEYKKIQEKQKPPSQWK